MFAFVGNGYACIVRTQRELDRLCLLYKYPKFKKCSNEEIAMEWLRQNSRSICTTDLQNYGDTSSSGYISVTYFIDKNFVCYNLDTSKLGFVRIRCNNDNISIMSSNNYIKVKINNLSLDDRLITTHIICIMRIVSLLGDFIDINVCVPDMSIFIACTKHMGDNYVNKKLVKQLNERKGAVSFTLRRR